MGLDINNYSRSYSTLQRLREYALRAEGNPKTLIEVYSGAPTAFDEFINHSDCEGGYISFTWFNINTIIASDATDTDRRNYILGNLDRLKDEMELLREAIETNLVDFGEDIYTKQAMMDFIEDVEEEEMLLRFH